MTHTRLARTITDLQPGDHLCCIYETEEEHRAVLTLFLRQGLERGEKVVYIVDARTAQAILDYLREDGLDVEPYLTSGQLSILTRDDAYMQEGVFDPEGMIALLRAETEQALAEGYPALRVTGEMTWALSKIPARGRGRPGSERLIEYEAGLNDFFPGSQCLAICQYDRRRFDSAVLLDVLRTHPIAVIGTDLYDNFYYVPPTELLGGDPRAAELRNWVQNLAKRVRAEEKLKEYSERLEEMVEERTQELRDAQERLIRREKLAVLGQLAAGVGHDLRNPLGAISNAAYFLNMVLEDPAPEVKESLEILAQEVRTCDRIITELLDFARTRPPIRWAVNVNALVQQALSRVEVPESVEVVTQLDETLPTIQADPDQLRQVFGNILLNAVQAMTLPSPFGTPEGGRLVIQTAEESRWVAVSFTDTGVGIPEENLDQLFEPLFTTKAKGIGLGLVMVKTLVDGHGGTIEVESELGKGSTFTVRLSIDGE